MTTPLRPRRSPAVAVVKTLPEDCMSFEKAAEYLGISSNQLFWVYNNQLVIAHCGAYSAENVIFSKYQLDESKSLILKELKKRKIRK